MMPALACTFTSSPPIATPFFPQATLTTEVDPYAGTALPLDLIVLPTPISFAPYPLPEIATPSATFSYPTDLSQLTNPTLLGNLSLNQQVVLDKQGFLTLSDGAWNGAEPILVTSDTVLAISWMFLAEMKAETESHFLVADLAALIQAMIQVSREQLQEAENVTAQEAARQNLAFFAVAGRLLDGNWQIPSEVQEVVEEELLLIGQSTGTFISPLFQQSHDYTLYQRQSAYAQTLIWFRQNAFVLPTSNLPLARLRGQQLVWMVASLSRSQNWGRWERIEQILAFGESRHPADLTMRELEAVVKAIYDNQPNNGSDVAQLDNLIATLGAHFPNQSVRWFGRGWSLAEEIFPTLLFNQVGSYEGVSEELPFTAAETPIGLIRALPHSLDMPALLGSQLAWNHLAAAQESAYQNFAQQFATQQAHWQAQQVEEWTTTLTGSWLYALQPLLSSTTTPNYPHFMRKSAWADKQLNSWLGGWALSFMTNYKREVETTPSTMPLVGYVEPYPELYARLGATVGQYAAGLDERGVLAEETAEQVEQFLLFLQMLQKMAEKENAGTPLTKSEQSLWRNFADLLTQFTPHLPLTIPIYTNENAGQTLYLTLETRPLYALVPIEKQPTLTIGSSFLLSQSKTIAPTEPVFWMNSYLTP